MKNKSSVVVTSRSFSRHPILKNELLSRYEKVTFNEEARSLKGDELVRFLQGHDKAIIALEKIDDENLAQLPKLKVIGKFGVGLDSFDLHALHRRGVLLGWQGGTNKRSVSELALTLMLSLLRNVSLSASELKSSIWKQNKGTCLTEKTVGLLGFGSVGKDLAKLLEIFNCRILCYDFVENDSFYDVAGAERVSLESLLQQADIVSIHLSLSPVTKNFMDTDKLALMRPSSILINTARGGIVDEKALFEALTQGRLAAAGFDVFESEPPIGSKLLSLPNFLATPHIGGSTEEAILSMGRVAIDGLENARPALEFLK